MVGPYRSPFPCPLTYYNGFLLFSTSVYHSYKYLHFGMSPSMFNRAKIGMREISPFHAIKETFPKWREPRYYDCEPYQSTFLGAKLARFWKGRW